MNNYNIALYGPSGAGKSTIARYLAQNHDFHHCSSGEACRSLCRTLFDSEDRTLLNQVTDALRQIDPSIWIRNALRGVRPGARVVFDSMRFVEDWHYFKMAGYVLWRVSAPPSVRHARLVQRGQIFTPGVDDVHSGETELASCDFDVVIENPISSTNEVFAQVERALRRLGHQ